ncbi:MAG: hypothetical protein C0613_04415 [Desulfobulbaceae bacterium]|nr:MAG: hypothetical protein C0613_04415 [Desulfobulbaceae bacterium]
MLHFDQRAIQATLPHRPPFLFIDRVIDVHPGRQGTGLKLLSAGELLLSSSAMLMPNIFHLEIMAQTTAMICAAMPEESGQAAAMPSGAGLGYLAGGDLHFTAPHAARAGETLEARVRIMKMWSQYILAQGSVHVGTRQLSQGRLTIALADPDRD